MSHQKMRPLIDKGKKILLISQEQKNGEKTFFLISKEKENEVQKLYLMTRQQLEAQDDADNIDKMFKKYQEKHQGPSFLGKIFSKLLGRMYNKNEKTRDFFEKQYFANKKYTAAHKESNAAQPHGGGLPENYPLYFRRKYFVHALVIAALVIAGIGVSSAAVFFIPLPGLWPLGIALGLAVLTPIALTLGVSFFSRLIDLISRCCKDSKIPFFEALTKYAIMATVFALVGGVAAVGGFFAGALLTFLFPSIPLLAAGAIMAVVTVAVTALILPALTTRLGHFLYKPKKTETETTSSSKTILSRLCSCSWLKRKKDSDFERLSDEEDGDVPLATFKEETTTIGSSEKETKRKFHKRPLGAFSEASKSAMTNPSFAATFPDGDENLNKNPSATKKPYPQKKDGRLFTSSESESGSESEYETASDSDTSSDTPSNH